MMNEKIEPDHSGGNYFGFGPGDFLKYRERFPAGSRRRTFHGLSFRSLRVAGQLNVETRSLARSRGHTDSPVVSVHNLVDEGEAQAGSTWETGLERFEQFFELGI